MFILCELTIGTIRETKEKCEYFHLLIKKECSQLLIQNQNHPIRSSSLPLPPSGRAYRDNGDAGENTTNGIASTTLQAGGKRLAVPKSVRSHFTLKLPTVC